MEFMGTCQEVLPSCIRNLTSLRVLDLSNNLLLVKFPTHNFANMMSLVQLSLSHNQLDGLLHLNFFSNHLQQKYLRLSSNSASFQVQTYLVSFRFLNYQTAT